MDIDTLAKELGKSARGHDLTLVGSACSKLITLVIQKQHGSMAAEQFRGFMRTYGYQDFISDAHCGGHGAAGTIVSPGPYRAPIARNSDPVTSHMAAEQKDESGLWHNIVAWLTENGPGTEEMILLGMGLEQRSSGSSAFARMTEAGWICTLVDPLTQKPFKLRNQSTRLAMVRGLPEHQFDPRILENLRVLFDQQQANSSPKRKGRIDLCQDTTPEGYPL